MPGTVTIFHFRRPFLLLLILSGLASVYPAHGWSPGTNDPLAAEGFMVDTSNRTDVLAFYNTVYFASEDSANHMNWNGDVLAGVAGTTSSQFKEDVRRRINLYRALVGLPADIVFDDAKSAKSQEAALMISANQKLSHSPPLNWLHYTIDGAEAAAKSNIALGRYGPTAIDGYIFDSGLNNAAVGHRRWILYSRAQVMGTGDIPPAGPSQWAASANWVIGDFKAATAPFFTAWPNEGYTPHTLMPERWSLSYPGASFASASVTMSRGGQPVALTVISKNVTVGDSTIVWEPESLPASLDDDVSYSVTVSGMEGNGVTDSYSYTVTLFDPNVLKDEVLIAGPVNPSLSGASYSFNSIEQADAYELRISRASPNVWTEGAEDVPAAQVIDQTMPGYALRQTDVKRSGEKAFHLTLPDFADQAFRISREIIPAANSQLVFYDLGRFAVPTTTLAAEVSQDNGLSWNAIWSRVGVGTSSENWDQNFIQRTVDLSSFKEKTILIRFILRHNDASAIINTTTNAGFFIDDISVTNAMELVDTVTTELPGGAQSFDFNTSVTGAILEAGVDYHVRIRPNVGTLWFADGPRLVITPHASPTIWYSQASHLPDGWRYFNWFKGFKPGPGNWIYHGRHGWLFALGENTQGLFLWDAALGRWLWTNENVYPWIYAYGPNESWIFFFEGGRPGKRFFKRGDNGVVVSEAALKVN